MKKLKSVIAWLLAWLIIFSASSCQFVFISENDRFNLFIEDLPLSCMDANSLDLNYFLNDPERAGFSLELLELPVSDKEDYEQSAEAMKLFLEQLHQFNRGLLSEENRLTYDIVEDFVERSSRLLSYYYLDNNYLGSLIGFQAQLPLLLSEYSFNRQNDLDSYFHILETMEDTFRQYAEIEKERQQNDCGMSQTILDKVIEQCNNITAEKEPFLTEIINDKIDQVDFLTTEEKNQAKEKNEQMLKNNYRDAYRALAEELSGIKGSKDDFGLWSKPQGQEYYETLLQVNTGVDATVDEIYDYFSAKFDELSDRFQRLYLENPDLLEQMEKDEVYCDFTGAEQTIDYLRERVKQDFPELETLSYAVHQVPKEMAENFSPAAYIVSQIDAPFTESESVYLNGEFDQSFFSTLMHEAYPGHMYQSVYFKSLKKPLIRYMVEYLGYSEGWATYVEHNSYRYAPSDNRVLLEAWEINSEMIECCAAQMDIGIHYDGWDRDYFYEVYQELFGDVSREHSDRTYDLILETPTNYICYYLTGFLLQDLYDEAKEALGDRFFDADFHEVILSAGPSPYWILEQQVNSYIGSTAENIPEYSENGFAHSA